MVHSGSRLAPPDTQPILEAYLTTSAEWRYTSFMGIGYHGTKLVILGETH